MHASGRIVVGVTAVLAALSAPLAHGAQDGADSRTNAQAPYLLPIPPTAVPRDAYSAPHHDHPSVDLPTPTGTEAFAVTSGQAEVFSDDNCGNGIELTGEDGVLYTYCHLDSHAIATGPVQAGQLVGATGNTGSSTGPHLHFQIKTSGTLRCPQTFLLAIFDGVPPPLPTDLPTEGCYY